MDDVELLTALGAAYARVSVEGVAALGDVEALEREALRRHLEQRGGGCAMISTSPCCPVLLWRPVDRARAAE